MARTISMALLALLVAVPAAAQQPGSPERGAAVAAQWCSNCHVGEAAGRGHGSDAVPPLATVALRGDDWLRAFLTRPHGQMPDIALSIQEIEDVVAYLRTLTPS